jgi:hypothetical protein
MEAFWQESITYLQGFLRIVLEDENRRLKQIVADQALDIRALKELLSKNFQSPRSGV